MCVKTTTTMKGNLSPLPLKLAKITVILIYFCFTECAAGSCLSYGHACWGAHGKRSYEQFPIKDSPQTNKDLIGTRWFLSRLIQKSLDPTRYNNNNINNNDNGRDIEIPTSQHTNGVERQLYGDINLGLDPFKGDDYQKIGKDPVSDEDTNAFLDEIYPRHRSSSDKIEAAKFIDNRWMKAL